MTGREPEGKGVFMPIEKILVRLMIVLAVVFVVLSFTFYTPMHAGLPLVFLAVFLAADRVLSMHASNEPEKLPKPASKTVVIFLSLAVAGCVIGLFAIWRWGYFWRLN
jgi:hypothetical protein